MLRVEIAQRSVRQDVRGAGSACQTHVRRAEKKSARVGAFSHLLAERVGFSQSD